MHTEFRLKKILDDAGVDTHGRIQRIVQGTGVNRHTIRKIYNNEATNVSLQTVGRICAWLEEKGYCAGLPGALFAARPSKLLGAMAEPGLVTFYLGEYRSTGFPKFRVARDDAAAASMLVHSLSRPAEIPRLQFSHVHVPSHVPADHEEVKASSFKADKIAAAAIFRRMRKDRAGGTAVLVGSQRANYLVEWYLSELYGCPAFEPGGDVPFYLKYHEKAWVASCFGGNDPPTGGGADEPPGIYYRKGGQWLVLRSEPRRRGAGVVIVRRDPGLGRLELAVFGVSAISTAATAKFICDTPDRFWPAGRVQAGLQVGIYLCAFQLGGMKTGEEGIDTTEVGIPEIIDLEVDLPGKRPRRVRSGQRRGDR
jgi:DNA-binding Xre family transcriptional regulator